MDIIDIIDDQYTTERFSSYSKCIHINTKGIGILHLNIRSINSNFKQFLILFDGIKDNTDIMILTECWFNPSKQNFLYNIINYSIFY